VRRARIVSAAIRIPGRAHRPETTVAATSSASALPGASFTASSVAHQAAQPRVARIIAIIQLRWRLRE
jgi:hypothetical protein